MANLKLNHVYKVYPNGTKAVNDFCMDIEDKEFIVFVGPSGCGKSTTLRMIAGLEEITAGEISIGDMVVNDVEPKDRDIAMVFQNYALYPHMTVYQNMAFGLNMRKIPKSETDRRVREAAEILGITDYLNSKPSAMSGGQRQRVALGRAMVREPKVFLLDEPLSNLDAKLRTQMRSEIAKLHQKLQTTFIYVTHDQVEAMTMGTRIVVMKDGFVQQIDTPRNLYSYPVNKFVAGFIGTPQMNFYAGRLKAENGMVRVTFDNTEVDLTAPAEYFAKADEKYFGGDKPVVLGIRLEHISSDPEKYPFKAKCRVSYVEDLGIDGQLYADFNLESGDTITESPTKLVVKVPAGSFYATGEIIDISLDLSHLHIFDAETEETIVPRIPPKTAVRAKVKGGEITVLGKALALPEAMRCADGDYKMVIPVTALSLGGPIAAQFAGEENVNGQRLVRLDACGKALFVPASADESADGGLAVDLKQCALYNGEQLEVSPLPAENELSAKIVKGDTIKESGGDGKSVKRVAYKLEIAGKSFECPAETAEKIINGVGKKVYGSALSFRFSPYAASSGSDGIAAKVLRILDYGGEKFAECSVTDKVTEIKAGKKADKVETIAEKKVYIAVGSEFNADRLTLVPDISAAGIYEVARDIRLV